MPAEPHPSITIPAKKNGSSVVVGITYGLLAVCMGATGTAIWTLRGEHDTNEANRIAIINLEIQDKLFSQQVSDLKHQLDMGSLSQKVVEKIEIRLDSLEQHYNETHSVLNSLEHDIANIDHSIDRIEKATTSFGSRLDLLFENMTGRKVDSSRAQ